VNQMKQLKYWLPLLVLILISCQTGTENNNITDETSGIKTETTVESRLDPDLPSKNFEGMEFVFLNRGLEENGTIKHFSEAASNEENGELMNDAVYRRNRSIEAKYNVEIKGVISNDLREVTENAKIVSRNVNESSKGVIEIALGAVDLSHASEEAAMNSERASNSLTNISDSLKSITSRTIELNNSIIEIDNSSGGVTTIAEETNEAVKKINTLVEDFNKSISKYKLN